MVSCETRVVDVLVAGGGVGGAMAAVRAQSRGARVLWLTGSGGASQRISSMNAALGDGPEDVAAGLFDDMFHAGGYVSRPDLLARVVGATGPEVRWLEGLGVPFAVDDCRLARRQAAGSTKTWAVYSLGMIGADIVRALMERFESHAGPDDAMLRGGVVLDVRTGDDGGVAGALVHGPRDGVWLDVSASAVVMATGGAGQLFDNTTNPRGSRGTGYAIALELGAELIDMEFVSFEPFVTSAPSDMRGQDLPTTVMRQGARLRNGLGEEFLDTQSAPGKDVICRAMVREVAEGRGTESGSVVFDLTEMDPEVAAGYVQISQALRPRGMSIADARLEVMPAQHYLMGGIRIDAQCRSTVPGLFAVGEVAGGVHGAHRLAACGGSEVVAGGGIAGEAAARHALDAARPGTGGGSFDPAPELLGSHLDDASQADLDTIRRALGGGCGIIRTESELVEATGAVHDVLDRHRGPAGNRFIRRGAALAVTIADSALTRRESRGDHFRRDHPERDDENWLANIVTHQSTEGDIVLATVPIGSGNDHD